MLPPRQVIYPPPLDGKDGKPGEQGPRGPQGPAGPQGEQGERGERGADAVLPPLVPWKAEYVRNEHDLTTQVRAGPMGGAVQVVINVERDDRDLIQSLYFMPVAA